MVSLEHGSALVTLRWLPPYVAEDERAYLDALTVLGRIATPFTLMTVFAGGGKLSQAGEREQALWFKATRRHFQDHCRAVAIVRPGANEKMAHTFRRLWDMPIIATEQEDVARAFLAQHLPAA